MSDDSKLNIAAPVLEAPPAPESPMAGLSGLFADDSLAQTTAKFSVVEAFLKSLSKDQKFGEFMRDVLLTVMKVVKSEAGSILELDYQRNALFFRAVVGQSSDRVSDFVIPFGQGIVGHVAESKQPIVVSNVAENKMHLKAIQDAVGFETRNLIALPILVRGRVFGVLELLNRIGDGDYGPADVDLLKYCCEMAAKAIEVRLMLSWVTQARAAAARGGDASGEGEAA